MAPHIFATTTLAQRQDLSYDKGTMKRTGKPVGRPPMGADAKTEQVKINLTADEARGLREYANGRRLGSVARELLIAALGQGDSTTI